MGASLGKSVKFAQHQVSSSARELGLKGLSNFPSLASSYSHKQPSAARIAIIAVLLIHFMACVNPTKLPTTATLTSNYNRYSPLALQLNGNHDHRTNPPLNLALFHPAKNKNNNNNLHSLPWSLVYIPHNYPHYHHTNEAQQHNHLNVDHKHNEERVNRNQNDHQHKHKQQLKTSTSNVTDRAPPATKRLIANQSAGKQQTSTLRNNHNRLKHHELQYLPKSIQFQRQQNPRTKIRSIEQFDEQDRIQQQENANQIRRDKLKLLFQRHLAPPLIEKTKQRTTTTTTSTSIPTKNQRQQNESNQGNAQIELLKSNNNLQLNQQQQQRTDIDECSCGNGAICDNLTASYRCACPPGFSGDPAIECNGKCQLHLYQVLQNVRQ